MTHLLLQIYLKHYFISFTDLRSPQMEYIYRILFVDISRPRMEGSLIDGRNSHICRHSYRWSEEDLEKFDYRGQPNWSH